MTARALVLPLRNWRIDFSRCAAFVGVFSRCTVSIQLLKVSSDIKTASGESRRAMTVTSASSTTQAKPLCYKVGDY